MKNWAPLESGDLIDVVSPGFSGKPEQIEASCRVLEQFGFRTRVPKDLFGKDVLCSNTDEIRLRHLQKALLSPESKAIWCVRGGYGTLRLLPGLAKMKQPKNSKLLIGLSDITVLHSFLNEVWDWPSLHAPNLERLGQRRIRPVHLRELVKILRGEVRELEIARLKPLNSFARKNLRVRGIWKGGNLVTVQGLMGLPAELDPRGAILFFEDIGERGYRVDRVLEQWRQQGFFKKAKAVVFGDFTEGLEANGQSRVPQVLKRFAESVSIPVVAGFPCGHDEVQRPVALGSEVELKLGRSASCRYHTGVCNE